MLRLPIWQVDAFTDKAFHGNPAAVCLLDRMPDDALLQAIAAENNLSETAFLLPEPEGECFRLRWFTPATEVTLCGHATLASAHVVFNHLDSRLETVRFQTLSGELTVRRGDNGFIMDFPARPCSSAPFSAETFQQALGQRPVAVYRSQEDWLAEYPDQASVQALQPDFAAIAKLPCRGLIATAPGNNPRHFVSRFFAPAVGVDEDPVTGSAHCALVPFWHQKTGEREFLAEQLSTRGGRLQCRYMDDRVELGGQTVEVLSGTLNLPAQ